MALSLVPVVEALYVYMTADSDFNTAIGGDASTAGSMYYSTAPNGSAFPFVVYEVTANRDELQCLSEASYAVSVTFTIFETKAAGPRACMDINDKLRTRLDRTTFSITDHTMLAATLEVERGPQDVDEAFFQQVSYLIRGFGS